MSLSLYNKYRPQTFDAVVGQGHVETTLANAVDKNTVSHAYLFCGPRGTGKTTTARILAKALLCKNGPSSKPDGTCNQCEAITNGIHPDVYELDAASRTGVDNVREEIIGRVNFAPTQGTHKVYIIDEVHMLSTPAFNALLKTLEEPPEHVVFVLCTTDVHKVPDTVQARCQRFDFRRIGATEIVGRLQYICEREGFDCEPAALELIAQRSQGGMRDAIRSLEQTAVFSGGKVSYFAAESLLGMVDTEQLFALCDNLAQGDAASCFDWVADYVQSGSDLAILVNDLAGHIRNLYAVKVARDSDEHLISALEIEPDTLPRLREQAGEFSSPERLGWMLSVLGSLSAELKNAANARLALEVALTRILHPESEQSLEALSARVAELEARLAQMTVVSTGAAVVPAPSRTTSQMTSNTTASAPTPSASNDVQAATSTTAPADNTPQEQVKEVSSDTSGQPAEPTPDQAQSGKAEAVQEQATAADPVEVEVVLSQEDDQSLHRQWNGVVDAIKKEKRGVAASLGGITPRLNSSGSKLTLELPADASTSKQYLETDANKSLIHNTVTKIFGRPLEVVYTLATAPQAKAEQKAPVNPIPEQAVIEPAPDTLEPLSESIEYAAVSTEPSASTTSAEPSKEELDAILGNSFNGTIKFEE